MTMQQTTFKDKYPIFQLELNKNECAFDSVESIIAHLHAKVEEHAKAVNIAIFDHYKHTQNIDGDINPEIKAAQNLILCFGMQLPSAEPVAVRPRSIGVTDLGNRFVINFMEAPNPVANETMEAWVKALIK